MSEYCVNCETVAKERDAARKDAERLAAACQATHDYFLHLCGQWDGKRKASGKPSVSGTFTIQTLCDIAGQLCIESLDAHKALMKRTKRSN